jgi:hypothetical protein
MIEEPLTIDMPRARVACMNLAARVADPDLFALRAREPAPVIEQLVIYALNAVDEVEAAGDEP